MIDISYKLNQRVDVEQLAFKHGHMHGASAHDLIDMHAGTLSCIRMRDRDFIFGFGRIRCSSGTRGV
jgi:hypothetical protein